MFFFSHRLSHFKATMSLSDAVIIFLPSNLNSHRKPTQQKYILTLPHVVREGSKESSRILQAVWADVPLRSCSRCPSQHTGTSDGRRVQVCARNCIYVKWSKKTEVCRVWSVTLRRFSQIDRGNVTVRVSLWDMRAVLIQALKTIIRKL